MQKFMLDTNTASFIIRGGNERLREKLKKAPAAALCISAVTAGELLFGLAKKPDATKLKKAVMAFLQRPSVLPWDAEAAEEYGALRARMEKAGNPLGNLDTLIAAHAVAQKAVLVSNDKAFSRVKGLAVEDWS